MRITPGFLLFVHSSPERNPKRAKACFLAILVTALAGWATTANAASVGPTGYTNSFATRPAATDFSTYGGIPGASGDITTAAALDAYVQNVTASSISAQVTDSSLADPPAKLGPAQWTSGGSAYLVTRPTGSRAGVLMATLVNNTGTNCNVLHFNYQLTVGASYPEEVPGQRLYYSLSTASNTWTLLPAVSGLNASGLVSADVFLSQTWNNGSILYLLWVDDNANDATESAYEIDNFFASAQLSNQPIIRSFAASTNQIWLGGAVTLSWNVTNATAIMIDQGVGLVPGPSGSVQVSPQTNTTYTLTATNTFGPRTAQVTVLVNQGIPVASNQTVFVALNTPAAITLAGSDPQGSNLTYAVVTAPSHGSLAGTAPNLTYTPGTNFIGNDQFTFKVNDGQFDSPPATVSIQVVAPLTVASFVPAPGLVSSLTSVTVSFSVPVDGVNSADLLVNSMPASKVSGSNNVYTFSFPPPLEGVVTLTWAPHHGIVDREVPPKSFDGTQTNEMAQYTFIDSIRPVVTAISPLPGVTLPNLTSLEVTFSEPVTGVDASNLRINGVNATAVTGSLAGPYQFTFTQPASGPVQIAWATNQGIHDLATTPNVFPGTNWSYTLDTSDAETNVIISEIMFHPVTDRTNDQYVELHNLGSTAVNLLDWRFSKGIPFTFPNVSLLTHGYLVVAADVASFSARYPGVTNVIGGWAGWMTSHLALQDAAGNVVNSVKYGTGGDWGTRLRGAGQDKVLSLTRSGSTATVTFLGNYDNGDTFTISGADQPEYNGTFTMSGVVNPAPRGCVSFNYTVSGTPATTATGTIVCRQFSDCGHTGWAWSSQAGGLGRSLELMDENLPNQYAQNWKPSSTPGSTPGQPNSVTTNNIAPMILNVLHYPLVPNSTNPVTITARLLDEHTNGIIAAVYWRVDASPANPFTAAPMFDDGLHGDGPAADGVYGAVIPPQANNAVVEFYVQATDLEGNTRTWPAPALETNNVLVQAANALYQVDNTVNSGTNGQPLLRLIMRDVDRAELETFPSASPWSDCKFNLTVISIDGVDSEVRYLCGIRDRGAGTRQRSPCSHEITFPDDQGWHGVNSINLNTQYTESQLMGYVLAMLGGLDTEAARIAQVRVNNVNRASSGSPQFGSYLQLERTDNNYVKNHWPGESGNIYRGQSWVHLCNLAYHDNPTNFLDYAIDGYSKQNNTIDNDWSDLINLCYALSITNVSDDTYAQNIRQVVDVEQWMRYFSVFIMSASLETAFATGVGDDYSLYRRSRDNRWILMAHDWDTILGEGDTTGQPTMPIFIMCPSVPFSTFSRDTYVMERFMKHPQFAPIYYGELKRLCDTVFSPAQMNPTLDQWLGNWVPTATINNMKTFNLNRWVYVVSQIPLKLTANTGLTSNGGYLYTTSPTVALNGQANAVDTRSVAVNGQPAAWTAWQATWASTITLNPGVNRVVVQAFNTNGVEFDRQTLDIWYNRGAETTVPAGTISGNTVWSPASGPYHLTGNLTIPSGTSLTIQPGTAVYFDSGVGITINGQLLAQGTSGQRIRFTRVPGTSVFWNGFSFSNARQSNVVAYADFEYAGSGSQAISIVNSQVLIDRMTFFNNNQTSKWLDIWQPQVTIRHSVFGDLGGQYFCTAENMLSDGWFVIDGNLFGKDTGDNDIFHLNRVSVKGGAAAIVMNNVFTGAGDDIVDDNETDTHIEGNLIMHANETSGGNHGASAAITTGPGGSLGVPNMLSQHLTVVRNVFYKNDYAIISKTGAYSQIYNNVFLANRGAIMFDETDRSDAGPGRQSYIESCIFWGNKPDDGLTNGVLIDLNDPVAFSTGRLSQGQPQVTVNNSILPARYHYLGTNNLDVDPLLVFPTNTFEISPTNAAFTTGFDGFDSSPYLLSGGGIPNVHLQTNSPALGAGFNGVDMGAYVSPDATIAGEPVSPTSHNDVTLTVGGTDLYGYKYRVLGPGFSASWSDEKEQMKPVYQITLSGTTATTTVTNHGYANGDWIYMLGADALTPYFNGLFQVTNVTANSFSYSVARGTNVLINQTQPRDLWCKKPQPIQLTGLASGTYQVEVVRKNSQGVWQSTAAPTVSKSWTVNGTWPDLQINEVLAWNATAVPVAGKYPDLIELYNRGGVSVDLSGMGISDRLDDAKKYVFAPGTYLGAGQYLVLYADSETTPPGYHLGFALGKEGESVFLFTQSGQLLDSVVFGLQVPDFSIGRLNDGSWALCRPTFGAANLPAQSGDPHKLKINEWLASGANPLPFIELFNPDPNPVCLSGLYLSGNLIGAPTEHQISPLSFISGNGFAVFLPDGNPDSGPTHLDFTLSADRGEIALSDQSLIVIDRVLYGPQTTGFSQGRGPSGSSNIVIFATPTPDAPNAAPVPSGGQLVINEVLAKNALGLTNIDGSTPAWIELYNPTTNAITLADMSLTDDTTAPRKWPFPAGVAIASGGYLLVVCDGSQPTSSTNVPLLNCGFGIPANGGSVYLFDKLANGGSLLDGISYGVQTSDLAIGRVPSGSTNWVLNLPTPGSLNIAAQLGDPTQLRLNEWMANPASGGKWFEMFNPNAQPVALSGLSLRDDTHIFILAPLSFIGNGLNGYTRFWADKDTAAGPDHVSFGIKATGNVLGIFTPNNAQIDYINFGPQVLGVSEGRLPDGSANIVPFPTTSTPGDSNFLPLSNVVVNEVLTHTDPPLEDAVELYNAGAQDVNIGGWFLSNSQGNPRKYRIADGVTVPAHGFVVFYEFQFDPIIGSSTPFTFNSAHGDNAYLTEADGAGNLSGYRAFATFGAAAHGVSFGRYTNSIGEVDFVAMSALTFGLDNPSTLEGFRTGTGAPNSAPLVGPVVLNEIMFNPPGTNGVNNMLDEYVELLNITSAAVPLFDPAAPTNTWTIAGGIAYTFPQNVTLPAGGCLLLVSFDPVMDQPALAEFLSRYQLTNPVSLFGPYSGHLDNAGESIVLYKPDPPQAPPHPDAGFVPYILVDQITYSADSPWPTNASGTGSSLQRLAPASYGNDPANWFVGAPTAAQPNTLSPLDTNGDGLPDAWQIHYFDSISNPSARPGADPDHDGFNNLQEYLAGTDPTDSNSYLKLDSVEVGQTTSAISFKAVAGKTYTVLSSSNLFSGWSKLADVAAQVTNGVVTVPDPSPTLGPARFYRLVTPAQP